MTCAPVFPTPAAELAELAAECLAIELHHGGALSPETPRNTTRGMLTDHARDLGIPAGEIEAAVDAAIKAANTKEPATT